MVVRRKEWSVARLLGMLGFVEAACALLFFPAVFALRGVIFGILAYRFGEKKLGAWGVVANIVAAGIGVWISLQSGQVAGL